LSIMNLYVLGFIFDILIGDPYWCFHPVRVIGMLIEKFEAIIRKRAFSEKQLRIGGVVLCFATVFSSMLITALVLILFKGIADILYYIGIVYFSYAVLSIKGLAYEAKMVKKALDISLEDARKRVSYIVGRDTTNLTEDEVIKATVETVAENTTDGIVTPLIYLFIGGPIFAIGFKAVSTLDSMVGYKNDKYIDLGRFSAKMDDALNYIPARIAGFLMAISAGLCGLDMKNSFKILKRDKRNHLSPNCGLTESAAAGALNIQLGGEHEYFGKSVYKPTIGDSIKEVKADDIIAMNKLMYVTAFLSLILCALVYFGISYIL